MEYRYMGKTGLQLSVLSFGSWITFSKQIGDTTADELMGIAYDNGINFFDNAEVYAKGESELQMGRVLKSKQWERSSIVVSSKAFFGWRGESNKPNQSGLSRKHLVEACEEALTRLQLDYLDIFYCHRPDKNVPIEEVVWTMHQLILSGKILYWGTSEWSAAEIVEAHLVAQKLGLIGPSVEQPQYNLFERNKIENEYDTIFKNLGMGTTIWSPLASGLLTGKYNDGIPENSRLSLEGFDWLKDRTLNNERIEKVKSLKLVADKLNTSLSSLSIAWVIKNTRVTSAILGATKKEQLIENLKSLEVLPLLTSEIMDDIDLVMNNKPIKPQF